MRTTIFALLVAVTGIVTFITTAFGQKTIQQFVYGKPLNFCVGDLQIQANETWRIDSLRSTSKGPTLLFGFLPWPLDKHQNTVVLLESSSGTLTIERRANRIDPETLLANCVANEFCKNGKSAFDTSSDVIEVVDGDKKFVQYILRPIFVTYDGDPTGIRIETSSECKD